MMKRTVGMAVATAALLLSVSGAWAQLIADVARASRKSKTQQGATTKYFDNDNLPRDQKLSVVGPQPSTDATSSASSASAEPNKEAQPAKEAANAGAAESKAPAAAAKSPADEKPAGDAMKTKIEALKQKIDTIGKELDLTEREYRLRAVQMYSDAGNRLRNAEQWDKDDAQYKKEIADKQAALDAAKQELGQMEEQERTGDNLSDKSSPIR